MEVIEYAVEAGDGCGVDKELGHGVWGKRPFKQF